MDLHDGLILDLFGSDTESEERSCNYIVSWFEVYPV